MTHTQQIIKDAIEGGWNDYKRLCADGPTALWMIPELKELVVYLKHPYTDYKIVVFVHNALLDSLFWQAVGKTRGWLNDKEWFEPTFTPGKPWWKKEWHQFIDHLAEGDDYETALSKLV